MEKLDVKAKRLLDKAKEQPLWVKILVGLVVLLLLKEIVLTFMVKRFFNDVHQFHQELKHEMRTFDEALDKKVNAFEAKFQAFKIQQEEKMNAREDFITQKQEAMSQSFKSE